MGGAGDAPTGTRTRDVGKRPLRLQTEVVSIPSGGSPDGTDGSPVLPRDELSDTLTTNMPCLRHWRVAEPRSGTGNEWCIGITLSESSFCCHGETLRNRAKNWQF